MAEQNQAIGAYAQYLYANEATWGVVNPSPTWRQIRLIGGETGDSNIAIYQSQEIRNDRMRNADVRGTQDPRGTLPLELSPSGMNWAFYHLLGGSVVTTGAGDPYTHVIKGSVALPVGFTLEKGFLGLDGGAKGYFPFYGCRINSLDLNMNINQIWSGSIEWVGREAGAPSATSLNVGAAPTPFISDPFTSAQLVISEGGSLDTLGIVTAATLRVTNNLYGDRGYVLGSNLRANLKPGARDTTGTIQYMFANTDLYEKAVAGTDTKLRFKATSGSHSIQIDLGTVDFTPSNSMPKVADDGPVTGDLTFKAVKDATNGTDIMVTILSPEADLT